MRYTWVGATLLSLALLGCKDAPVDPEAKKLTLEIQRNSVLFEEETLPVGGTLQLGTVVRDAAGKVVESTPPQWKSLDESVASVSATGLVTARQVGTTHLVATAGSAADTARVNVALPVSGELSCAAGGALSLAVGEVHTTTGDKAPTLCLEGGVAGAEFAYVPFNAASVGEAILTLSVAARPLVPVIGPPSPALQPAPLPISRERLTPDERFHGRLMELSRRRMEPRLRAAGPLPPTPPLTAAALPKVNDLLKLNVQSKDADPCANPDYRTGRVVAVTGKAIVVADTANPEGGFSEEDYRSIGATFDTLVWRVGTEAFGEPSDVDKNSRVILFYTRAVNELTSAGSDSYVGGYFYSRDIFPKSGSNACAGSNVAEMLYMLVPDPNGEINGNVRAVDFVRRRTIGVLAHELQHLINSERRLYVNKALVWEEPWLDEGLSHVAEELMFYAATGLQPRQNIGPEHLRTQRVVDAFNRYNADNVERLTRYLRNPDNSTLMGRDDLPTRGASWAFLRYAADRDGGSDTDLFRRLVDSRTRGLRNLAGVLGIDPRDWMQDWTASVYTDDAGLSVAPRYQQPSWNFRALIPTLRQGSVAVGHYPLRTHRITSGSTTLVSLRGGGAAFIRFGVAPGEKAALRSTVGDLPPPSLLRMSIVRTK